MLLSNALRYLRYYIPFKRSRDTAEAHYKYYLILLDKNPECELDIIDSAYSMRRYAREAEYLFQKLKGSSEVNKELSDIIEEANRALKFADNKNKMKRMLEN